MNKKENRMAVRQEVQKSVIRDEQNRRTCGHQSD